MNEFSVALRRAGIRVLVESLPTRIETAWPALDYLREALLAGVHAVTVNKSPLAYGHSQLVRAARRGRAKLAYTGTTGVRAPRLEPGERLLRIEGSLNGTSNYVLDLMQAHGIPFIRAVAMAQEAGIAEPEPDLDLEGWDTAFKLLILSRDLLGGPRTMGEIRRTGISPGIESLIRSASRTGKVVRLVGRAERSEGRVRASVAPCPVGPRSPLFDLPGASKRAVFTTSSGRKLVGVGRSGRREIAQVILADVLEVAGVGGRA
jgi:homoserine dehydrogenase